MNGMLIWPPWVCPASSRSPRRAFTVGMTSGVCALFRLASLLKSVQGHS